MDLVSRYLALAQANPVAIASTNRAATWEQIKDLHPQLPSHVRIQPRNYLGETWYVLHDTLSNQFHRLNKTAYHFLAFMDGQRTLAEIFALVQPQNTNDEEITNTELVQLLQYLHASDLLISEAPPKAEAIALRQEQKRHNKIQQLIKNPVVWRIPLFNPNALLTKLLPLARFLTSPLAAFIWLVVVFFALAQAIIHWPQLTSHSFKEVFSPANLLLIWLIYPLLKVFHELGHALFTKAWQGPVYECGIVFVMATPLPYVDASAATGIASKRKRLMVSAAGMAVELFIASMALLFWLDADEGLFKSILFNIVLIGGVSTLLFNCNPLMRFDGYYLLSDLLDLPNLAKRAQTQLIYGVQKGVLRLDPKPPQTQSQAEAIGLFTYAVAAMLYRALVIISIVMIAAALSVTLGLVLAAWLFIVQCVWPLIQFARFLLFSPELMQRRLKVTVSTLACLALVAGLVFFLPIPFYSQAQGIVWLPDNALIRSEAGGIVTKEWIKDGDQVTTGQTLMQLYNPELEAELKIYRLRLQEAEIRYQGAWLLDRNQVERYAEDINTIQAEITLLETRVAALLVKSPGPGIYKLVRPHALTGSFVRRGDTLAIIHLPGAARIRTALDQEEIAAVRNQTQRIELKSASHPGQTWQGTIAYDVPGGTFKLPSAALGSAGGGAIAVSNTDEQGTQALEEVFLLDITLPTPLPNENFGERVSIRFYYPAQSIAYQIFLGGQKLLRRILDDNPKSRG